MEKLDININLTQCNKAFLHDIQGRERTEKCLCIPLSALSVDTKGRVWLNMRATPTTKSDTQSHFITQILSREQFSSIPVGENGYRQLTIIGSIKPYTRGNAAAASQPQADANNEELPF